MVRFAGVLIDAKRAVVVRGDSHGVEVLRIESAIEDRMKVADGGGRPVPDHGQDTWSDGQREGLRVMQLRRYFDRVVDAIRGCNRFVILGPDEVKTQLRKHLDRIPDQAHRIVAVNTAQAMTDQELIRVVKGFFAP